MKALALTVALGLLAALQAQDPLALLLPEEQNVRLGWAGWGQGRGHPGWSGSHLLREVSFRPGRGPRAPSWGFARP